MVTVTLKIDDIDSVNKSCYVYVGSHGHQIYFDEIKERAASTKHEHITREQLTSTIILLIGKKASQLGIAPKDLTLAQIRNAIEVEVNL